MTEVRPGVADGAEGAGAVPPASDAAGGPVPEQESLTDAVDAEPDRVVFPHFRVVDVDEVSLDLPAQYPMVTLLEAEPPQRELHFPVGLPEGTALALALHRVEGRRPTTHELFTRVLQRVRVDVIAVRLVGREEGTLLAELDLMTALGRERVDCRPSDGLVLALRMPVPAPILVDERLLEELGDVVPLDPPA